MFDGSGFAQIQNMSSTPPVIIAQLAIFAALIAGAVKCFVISRRPQTNKICVLSLMLFLLGWAFSIVLTNSTVIWELPRPVHFVWAGFLVLVFITGAVLGVVGLIHRYAEKSKYNQ